MKLNLLPVVAALSVASSSTSQITIDSPDLPQPGVTYPLVNAAIADITLGELAGANVTWDASALLPISEAPITPVSMSQASITANLVFNSPFNSTYQCDFFLPTEFPDLGVDLGIPLDGFNNFYQTDGSAYTIAGIGLTASGFDLPITYDDIDEILPLPLDFGDEMTSTAAFELDLTGLLSYALAQERHVVVDGWGTLLLPSGAYDVLRTRTDLTATDDVFIEQLGEPFTIEREQTTYQWWGQGTGFPLLEITEIAGFSVVGTYQDLGQIGNDVGLVSPSDSDLAYPNPVARGAQVQWAEVANWELYNANGHLVSSGFGNSFHVPSHLAPGMYVLSQNGSNQRFMVK